MISKHDAFVFPETTGSVVDESIKEASSQVGSKGWLPSVWIVSAIID